MARRLSHLWLIACAGLTALVLAAYSRIPGNLNRLLYAGQEWATVLQQAMAANWLAFGIGQVIIASTGVLPASIIAIMAGATFGLGWGLAISMIGTMLGGWLAFCLSRTALRGFISRHLHRHALAARFDNVVGKEGWRFVLLLRASPIMPFALTSYGLGLTRISQKEFLLGTLASLPALIGYVALGALGQQGMALANGEASVWRWLSLAGGALLVFYAMRRIRRAMSECELA